MDLATINTMVLGDDGQPDPRMVAVWNAALQEAERLADRKKRVMANMFNENLSESSKRLNVTLETICDDIRALRLPEKKD